MDKEAFKADLKQLVANNPHEFKFVLSYSDYRAREEFTKKKEFGTRLLAVFEEEEIESIKINSLAVKGYLGRTTVSMETAKNTTNIDSIDLFILRVIEAEKWREQKRKEDDFFYKNIGK